MKLFLGKALLVVACGEALQHLGGGRLRGGGVVAVPRRCAETSSSSGSPSESLQVSQADASWKSLGDLTREELERRKVWVAFDADVVEAARSLFLVESSSSSSSSLAPPSSEASESPDPDASRRRDLRHLTSVAIDDASTVEVDDAFGFEGETLWIHVADPTRWVPLDSALDLEARRRCSSVYVPTGVVPMYPLDVAASVFSLHDDRGGDSKCALSVGVRVGEDGLLGQGLEVTPALIRPPTRLTYEEADAALAVVSGADETLGRAHAVARRRRAWRQSRGSIERVTPSVMPELRVRLNGGDDGDQVDLYPLNASASRDVVLETMVLFGEAVAAYARRNRLPMPFRAQAPVAYDDDDARHHQHHNFSALSEQSLARTWAAIRRQRPAKVVSRARPHFSLGLDAYVQASSPIRRYMDVAAHYQLKAHLRGEKPPFSAADLVLLATRKQARVPGIVANTLRAHAVKTYLRNHARRPFDALVLEVSTTRLEDEAPSASPTAPPANKSGTSPLRRRPPLSSKKMTTKARTYLLLTELGAVVFLEDANNAANLTRGTHLTVVANDRGTVDVVAPPCLSGPSVSEEGPTTVSAPPQNAAS